MKRILPVLSENEAAGTAGEADMKQIKGGVAAAKGFYAAAAAAGIKYQGRDDMALIYSEVPCVCAGTFTSNVVKAAPVLWDRKIVRESDKTVQAVIINSGVANACTGEQGMRICRAEAETAGSALSIDPEGVLVASTGVIGMQIDTEKIRAGIDLLAERKAHSFEAGDLASKAIMTTDTKNKQLAFSFEIAGRTVTIGGMCKGSGMIHPGMCTMLAFITTDLAIDKKLLQKAVSIVVEDSFNMISVDGDMSTNDTLLVLANGEAGNPVLTEENADYICFYEALEMICKCLAKEMAGDGEGATRLIEAAVVNAASVKDAKLLAKSVIQSNLTKAAVFGRDANWGRVLCALGYSGARFDPENVDLYFASETKSILIFSKGCAAAYSEEEASQILGGENVIIRCDMHMGSAGATAWGCDLSYDYVRINADYRS